MTNSISLHWFRRDLRIAGNRALRLHAKSSKSTLGIFFFDSKFLSREDFSNNRFAFFLDTLKLLKEDLNEIGSDLLVVDEAPDLGFQNIINFLIKSHYKLTKVTFNRDYEPFAVKRDNLILEQFKRNQVPVESFKDHLIFEPDEIFKESQGDFYQVYTPFYNKWKKLAESSGLNKSISEEEKGINFLETTKKEKVFQANWVDLKKITGFPYVDTLEEFIQKNKSRVTVSIPKAGSLHALNRLKQFKSSLSSYATNRNYPNIDGTSGLSLFLKNGSFTTRQIVHVLDLLNMKSDEVFLKEIVWREFYYSILFHRPDVEKNAFKKEYNNLAWQNNEDWFSRWKEGLTGFPIVDAGIRQLNQTGWMHNRVRMIVASFLVKDLLIDWRWGENYFMKNLLDGDLAPNNGGWQWAASTGCDSQPYFRVFNPWLQSEKFDPGANYIKTYVPELRNIQPSDIHDPQGLRPHYPKPIVNHAEQKEKAIALFKK
jgi:deoxyribodipyrimidine photo-lyase